MAELRTEEEQVEALKNWWRENGRSTLLGVALAGLAVFGWRGWQQHQQQTEEAASIAYQNMMSAAATQPGAPLSDERRQTASHLAGELKSEFSDSAYAQYAALWLAKSAVESGALDQARQELEWILTQQPEAALDEVVRMRLARVLLAQGQPEQALNQLGDGAAEGFQSSFYEIKGDIHRALDQDEEARAAYQKAVAAAQESAHPLLAMKLDDLATAGAQ